MFNACNYSLMQPQLIVDLYNKASNISCVPDKSKFPKVKTGDVIDEDKSVKWNRTEIERLQTAYQEEAKRLNTIKNTAINEVETLIKDLIIEDIRCNIDDKTTAWYKNAANVIYKRSTAEGFTDGSGINDVLESVKKYLKFISDIFSCNK